MALTLCHQLPQLHALKLLHPEIKQIKCHNRSPICQIKETRSPSFVDPSNNLVVVVMHTFFFFFFFMNSFDLCCVMHMRKPNVLWYFLCCASEDALEKLFSSNPFD
ncbi:hypothetical protein HPP92_023478 [Vanilla planifolia]|uniref:Uncharacterized protein n=1 Tax=Vanilla planifolia TaxID=51239 RepID=A0A835PKP1_VANPL|nr:hypothetical protein HPP92_023478 [Vanilla planifolia]